MPCSSEVSECDSWKDKLNPSERRPSSFYWVPLEYYALLTLGIDIHSRLLPHQINLLNATFSHRRVRTSHLGVNNKQLCGPRIEKGSNGHTRVTVKLDVRSGDDTVPGVIATLRIKDYLYAKHHVTLQCDQTPLVIIPTSGERFALQCLDVSIEI